MPVWDIAVKSKASAYLKLCRPAYFICSHPPYKFLHTLHQNFHVDLRHGTTDFIADSDLTSLFSNLLDNAMEAACGIPEAFIEINTARRANTPFTVITVINSSRKNPFSNPQGSLATNKSDKHSHGFGIKSVRKTVNKYQGDIKMYYNDDNLAFHTIIGIKML